MNALGLAYSSDDSDAESAKSNVSIDSKSSSGMSHNSVTKANDGEVLTRSRNNSFEGETNVKSSQDVGNLQKMDEFVLKNSKNGWARSKIVKKR